jgi:excisionase family DNA binding protein
MKTARESPAYDPLMPTSEAAAYLSIHPDTLREMARLRQIASVPGHRLRFRLSHLNNYITKHEQKPLRGSG